MHANNTAQHNYCRLLKQNDFPSVFSNSDFFHKNA